VTVREAERKEKSSTVRFVIKDTGIGMTEEQSSRLFIAFEQADTSISRRFGGTGLGLAISKNIVEKMGGRIWVESEIGKGSAFAFEVELEHDERIESEDNTSEFNGMKILVASNDVRICEYFESVVSGLGITADTATGAEDMVSLVSAAYNNKRLYDMIFIDYDLRCNDIFKLAKRINEKAEDNTVVLMSSFITWSKIDVKTRGSGINRFISTPLLPSNILRSLRREDIRESKPTTATEPEIKEVPNFSGINVLLAEDLEINREIFLALLEETKINIDTAENGLIAVEKFSQNPDKYDLIIMDVHMPEMDGFEATTTIRRMEISKARTIPIVAMTADVFREDVDKCLSCGMNDHLAKPVDEADVIRKISAYAFPR
jgi:CheY-like chemotaxis protein